MPYVPASDLEAIEALYIGYFGRAGEPGGVNYWVERMEDGMTFAEVAASFSVQPEAKAQHPFLANPATGDAEAFVASLYSQLLNRDDAKTADPTGFKYWVDALKAAQGDTLDIGLLIAQFISGAQGIDIQTIQNKVAGAIYFTQELEAAGITGVDSKGQVTAETKEIGAAVVDGITSNPASVAESREETDAYVEDGTIPDPSGGGGNPGGGGGNPGGGGGSGSGTGIIFNAATGVLTLNDARDYSVTASSADGFEVRIDGVVRETYSAANLAALTEIHVRNAGGDLEVAGEFLHNRTLEFSGAGSVNVTGVTIPAATATTPVEANVNLNGIEFANTGDRFVNGGAEDYFKARWDVLDDRYTGATPSVVVATNIAFVQLGNEYIAYLRAHGAPIDELAKVGTDRSQTFHDNILSNLTDYALAQRLNEYALNNGQKGYDRDYRVNVGEFADRPQNGGYTNDNPDADGIASAAWDIARGYGLVDTTNGIAANTIYVINFAPWLAANPPPSTAPTVDVYTSADTAFAALTAGDYVLFGSGAYEDYLTIAAGANNVTVVGVPGATFTGGIDVNGTTGHNFGRLQIIRDLFNLTGDAADVNMVAGGNLYWEVDRAAPGSFTTVADPAAPGNQVLSFGLNSAGPQTGFDSYVGVKIRPEAPSFFDANTGSQLSYNFYINPVWSSDGLETHQSGVWVQLNEASNFAIAEYVDADHVDLLATGANGQTIPPADFDQGFRFWSAQTGTWSGYFETTATGWVNVSFSFVNGHPTWYVNGNPVYTDTYTATSTTNIDTIIVNSRNNGTNEAFLYDNVKLTGIVLGSEAIYA